MKNIISIFILLISLSCKSQLNDLPTVNQAIDITILDSIYIASKTQYFKIEDYQLKGKGEKTIQNIINHSQFIVLGESHGSSKIAEFTATLIPLLSKVGFDNFAIEVGPHSANKLKTLSISSENTSQNLHDFYTKYSFNEIDDLPIPFFDGIEDAIFLEATSKHNMDLWGLDQEYYSSIIYLTDELLNLAKNKSDFEKIKTLKQSADKIIKKWMIKEDNDDKGFPVFNFILKEPIIIQFFGIFNETDIEAQQIIADLKISWDIYNRYRGGESHNDRINYMRSNFKKNYDLKSKTTKQPKVLLKFGALHASKILSGDTHDIGNLTEEIAKENGTVSTNIRIYNRYFDTNGTIQDLLKTNPRYFKKNIPFISQAKKHQWAIINLKEIRADLKAGRLKLPENKKSQYLKNLIYGFDYELILPTDKYTTPNYK